MTKLHWLLILLILFNLSKSLSYDMTDGNLDEDNAIDNQINVTYSTLPVDVPYTIDEDPSVTFSVTLMGIGQYKEEPDKSIVFLLYFQKNAGKLKGRKMTFYIIASTSEGDEEVPVECELESEDSLLAYKCKAKPKTQVKIIGIASKGDYKFEGENKPECNTPPHMSEAMKKMHEQTKESPIKKTTIITLGNSIFEAKGPKMFTITGNVNEKFDAKKVTLTLKERGMEKKIECDVESEEFRFTLTCNDAIKTHLEGITATLNENTILLIQLTEEMKHKKLDTSRKDNLKVKLLGVGTFKHTHKVISFNIYFKRLAGEFNEILTFTINILFGRRLRGLEEIKKDTNCEMDGENSEESEFVKYSCEAEGVDSDFENIEVDESSMKFGDQEIGKDGLEMSDSVKEEMKKLKEQTEDSKYEVMMNHDIVEFILNRYEKPMIFYLLIEDPSKVVEEQDIKLKFSFDTKETVRRLQEEEKSINCKLTKMNDDEYKVVDCDEGETLNGKVESITGEGKKDNNHFYIDLNGTEPNFETPPTETPGKDNPPENKPESTDNTITNNFSRIASSKSGLSGGAIAAIVIVSAVALIAVAVLFFMCRTPPKPPMQVIQEESTLGVRNAQI